MSAYRSLARAMLRGFLRDRGSLIFTVALPVLFLVLLGSIYKGSSAPQVKVTEIGRVPLLDQAVKSGQLRAVLKVSRASSRASALQEVRQGDVDAAVSQEGSRLSLHYSIADQVTSGVVRALFSSLVQTANQEATGRPPAFTLATAQVEDTSLKPIQYLAPGLLGWAIASGATFGAAITLVNWRSKKLLRRLRLTPASTGAIAAARITVSMLVALVQLAVFLLIATLPYFGLKLTAWWWMSIPIVMAGTLAFLSLGLLAGAISKTEQAATALANMVILPMAFLGGAFVPLAFAPAWIQKVSYVMPLRYLVTGVQDVMARGDGPSAAVLPVVVLLGIAAVLTLAAVRLFRWDEI
ncbi:MAG TPA: ABC transporter permease [Streptosporangiaceae bacterium]|nr:ABC transporter permease [Streptosporangiaceae bacterium]